MEGFPADALKEYRTRKAEEAGLAPPTTDKPSVKRPRISYAPISEGDLQAQLQAHIALMKGPAVAVLPPPGMGMPPPGMPPFGFPPGGMGMPPPGMFPFSLPGPPPGWRPG